MKRLLLSLWLVGAAFPGHTPILLQTTQSPPASAEQLVTARTASPTPSLAMLEPTSVPELQHSGVERVAVRSLVMPQDTQSITPRLEDGQTKNLSAPLPSTEATHEPSVPIPEGNEAIWVEVIRWATVHAGPSVSAPTVRFYPVGTELHLIDYQHGWFQVLDPATSQRGWIYEKYYLQAISGPGQGRAVARNSPSPPRVALRVPKPRPPLRRVKRPAPQQHEKIQPRIASETVASLLEKAFRGY
jgi:hypothetical protein